MVAPLLAVAFLVVPLLEIWLISRVGHAIGFPATLLVLPAVSVAGAVIVRREGVRAWRALVGAGTGTGWPGREIADGALVLVGGALLLAPGFLTDAVGLLLVAPPTRAVARRLLRRLLVRRALRRASRWAAARPGRVVEGEVLHGGRPPRT